MSKIIAIWGAPHSGKTTLAVKLGKAIHDSYKAKVLCVFADPDTPTLPVLFPGEPCPSVGGVLSQPEITPELMYRHLVTVKAMPDFGVLGYAYAENRNSYAQYSMAQAGAFFDTLCGCADFILVDCTSRLDDVLSDVALKKADMVLRLTTPELRSLSFFASKLPGLDDAEKHVQTLNVICGDVALPVNDSMGTGGIAYIIPFCPTVKQQMADAALLKGVKEKPYLSALTKLVERVVQH